VTIWKRGVTVLAVSGLLAAGGGGCGERHRPVLTAHEGYPVYREYCRRCHGNLGDGGKASRVAHRPVVLFAPAFRDTVDLAALRRIVAGGKGRMQGYREKLTGAQLDAVARYVLALPGPGGEADSLSHPGPETP